MDRVEWTPDTDWKKVAEDMMAAFAAEEAQQEEAQRRIMPKDRWALAEEIRNMRHHRKLTQADVALKLGVTKTVVSRLEAGKANPSYTTLVKLAEIFNYKLVWVEAA